MDVLELIVLAGIAFFLYQIANNLQGIKKSLDALLTAKKAKKYEDSGEDNPGP